MEQPAKKKYVSAEGFLGDQYEEMSKKKETGASKKTSRKTMTAPKKIVPSKSAKPSKPVDSKSKTARYLEDPNYDIQPHTATPYMTPTV